MFLCHLIAGTNFKFDVSIISKMKTFFMFKMMLSSVALQENDAVQRNHEVSMMSLVIINLVICLVEYLMLKDIHLHYVVNNSIYF